MPAAPAAQPFDALHSQAVVFAHLDFFRIGRFPEAGPAAAGVELRVRGEQLRAAAGAAVGAVLVMVPVLAGEGAFGSRLPQHAELLGRQRLPPLLVALRDLLVAHFEPFRNEMLFGEASFRTDPP